MRELLGSVTLEMTGIGAERELSRAMKRGVRMGLVFAKRSRVAQTHASVSASACSTDGSRR